MSPAEFDRCFGLIEETSSADYKAASTHGWDPDWKKKEMRLPVMRYLLVRREPDAKGESQENDSKILAFLSFMLTMDDNERDSVLYVYELHLDTTVRSTGLGKYLMGFAETIGKNVGVVKIMLTVFTSNEHAEAFYRRLGYDNDVSSPEAKKLRGGVVKKPDYWILGKEL
jgi:ribosomal protein S18 acetylase RimI-like enzyme